jgi:hypothetical protein
VSISSDVPRDLAAEREGRQVSGRRWRKGSPGHLCRYLASPGLRPGAAQVRSDDLGPGHLDPSDRWWAIPLGAVRAHPRPSQARRAASLHTLSWCDPGPATAEPRCTSPTTTCDGRTASPRSTPRKDGQTPVEGDVGGGEPPQRPGAWRALFDAAILVYKPRCWLTSRLAAELDLSGSSGAPAEPRSTALISRQGAAAAQVVSSGKLCQRSDPGASGNGRGPFRVGDESLAGLEKLTAV